jgi:hypothetical protein
MLQISTLAAGSLGEGMVALRRIRLLLLVSQITRRLVNSQFWNNVPKNRNNSL